MSSKKMKHMLGWCLRFQASRTCGKNGVSRAAEHRQNTETLFWPGLPLWRICRHVIQQNTYPGPVLGMPTYIYLQCCMQCISQSPWRSCKLQQSIVIVVHLTPWVIAFSTRTFMSTPSKMSLCWSQSRGKINLCVVLNLPITCSSCILTGFYARLTANRLGRFEFGFRRKPLWIGKFRCITYDLIQNVFSRFMLDLFCMKVFDNCEWPHTLAVDEVFEQCFEVGGEALELESFQMIEVRYNHILWVPGHVHNL